jgi:predicted short-subunit dehydrogenase-like oxidoreductase (DUF2520 family)
MQHSDIRKVVILGAGNLAWHFGHWLSHAGVQVLQVFSRTPRAGESLAAELHAGYTNRLDLLQDDTDLYLLAVTDDAIASLVRQAGFGNQLVVHAAGSVSIDVFAGKVRNYGILYPLQTFTQGKPVDYCNIPLFIEANKQMNLEKIKSLAGKLSNRVYTVDSEKANLSPPGCSCASNFTNHMFALTDKLLRKETCHLN